MKLPKNILQKSYERPNLYLCKPNKEKICKLDPITLSGVFKFNAYSELNFEISRKYLNIITGKNNPNPYYDFIEGVSLVYLEGFGYFEIQTPNLESDGIKESKEITAYSYEYSLSHKFLYDLKINTGETDSLEVINSDGKNIIPISLYNTSDKNLSLLDIVLENVYGWKIGHIDSELKTLTRSFDISRTSVYDFLTKDICEKFNCYVLFDTVKNEINIYAESKTFKITADGKTNKYIISPAFNDIGSVSIDGYLTTKWNYNNETGEITFEETPKANSYIEIVDNSLGSWETDILVSFKNLANEMKISYDANDIKTKLRVTYGDNIDIREANLGQPYLLDLSYFHTIEWMGQDLYDAYNNYLTLVNTITPQYEELSKQMLELAGKIDYEKNRLSLGYSVVNSVGPETIGTYYVRGGTSPDYFYTAVSLPADYKAGTTYYSMKTTNLNEKKVEEIYSLLKKYYTKDETWKTYIDEIKNDFSYMEDTFNKFKNDLTNANNIEQSDLAVLTFLSAMWKEIGYNPINLIYKKKYKQVQIVNIDAGWSDPKNKNYYFYYPVTLFLDSIEKELKQREAIIKNYQDSYNELQKQKFELADQINFNKYFTEDQLNILNNFIREDEINFSDIVETDQDSMTEIFRNKQHAIENGRIELNKISQPKLQFSMTMANIYALKEFEPIVNQFQLGNIIKISLRKNYIKNSRLLQVNINFNDFSDFSCEFGELTTIKTQSSLHADLLSQAISAGKSVASNSGRWTQGSDVANEIDKKIDKGLLDAVTEIKATDGTQGAVIDKYGIRLQKKNENDEIDPEQIWMVNNKLVFTDDNFKTCKSALGKVKVDDKYYYGLISELVLSGYVEGSKIRGGSIQIGKNPDGTYAFEVLPDGTVKMSSGTISGYPTIDDIDGIMDGINQDITDVNNNMDNINSGMSDINNNIDGINGSIGNINSSIDGINGDIGNINGDITDINGNITNINKNIDNINGTLIEKEEIYNNKFSSFEKTDNEIKASVGEITESIGNMIIGGNNILSKTNQGTINWEYASSNDGAARLFEEEENGLKFPRFECWNSSAEWIIASYSLYKTLKLLEPNSDYMLSFDFRSNITTELMIGIKNKNSSKPLAEDVYAMYSDINQWKKLIIPIRTNDLSAGLDYQVLYFYGLKKIMGSNNPGKYWIKNLQLEKGNKATEWTPSHFDIEDSTNEQFIDATDRITQVEATSASLLAQTGEIRGTVENVQKNIKTGLDGVNKDLNEIRNSVDTKMTATEVRTEISSVIKEEGITKVDTKTGFTFDLNGLTINSSESDINTNVNENGMKIKRNETIVLNVDNRGVDAENLHATTYLIIGDHCRFEENKSNGRIGCYYIN